MKSTVTVTRGDITQSTVADIGKSCEVMTRKDAIKDFVNAPCMVTTSTFEILATIDGMLKEQLVADCNVVLDDGHTNVSALIMLCGMQADQEKNLTIAKYLLTCLPAANINYALASGRTALILAARWNQPKIVRLLKL